MIAYGYVQTTLMMPWTCSVALHSVIYPSICIKLLCLSLTLRILNVLAGQGDRTYIPSVQLGANEFIFKSINLPKHSACMCMSCCKSSHSHRCDHFAMPNINIWPSNGIDAVSSADKLDNRNESLSSWSHDAAQS